MTTAKKLMTAEDLLALPDDGFHKYELMDGVLITMPPDGEQHGTSLMRTGAVFLSYVDVHNLGRVTVGDVGYILRRGPGTGRGARLGVPRWGRVPRGPGPP